MLPSFPERKHTHLFSRLRFFKASTPRWILLGPSRCRRHHRGDCGYPLPHKWTVSWTRGFWSRLSWGPAVMKTPCRCPVALCPGGKGPQSPRDVEGDSFDWRWEVGRMQPVPEGQFTLIKINVGKERKARRSRAEFPLSSASDGVGTNRTLFKRWMQGCCWCYFWAFVCLRFISLNKSIHDASYLPGFYRESHCGDFRNFETQLCINTFANI